MSRYSATRNQMVRGDNIPTITQTALGAGTTNSASFNTEDASTVVATLAVTAVGGSPTLDVTLQTSPDDSTWTDISAFAQKTGVASEIKRFNGVGSYCRWKQVVAGTATPTETFTITGYTK